MSVLNKIAAAVLKPVVKEMSRASLPKLDGNIYVQGLQNEVEIIRDSWGVTHIYTDILEDAIFAQGFVHAQDRLWQMDLNRRAAGGKLAEIIGKDALDADRVARTFGYERAGKKDWELLSPEIKTYMKAYCNGVNAFIDNNTSSFPVEYKLLGLKPEPWTPVDVCAFSKMLTALLTFGWYDEIVRAKLIELIGIESAMEVDNTYPKENPVTLPKGIEFNKIDVDGKFAALNGPYIPKISGSNAWTIHGSKTKTGKPFLCNDPHLTLKNPNIWYQMHLHTKEYHVTGVSCPSIPLILIGHNEQIGWGITLAFTDIEDVFVEKFTDKTMETYMHDGKIMESKIIEEKIYIKDEKMPHIERVINTIHGTLISNVIPESHHAYTLCSMAFRPANTFDGWFRLNTAQNWNDFVDAVKCIQSPGLNIVYADIEGNIGYYNSGKVPVRNKQTASVPMPGWTSEYDWNQFVPFEEMPHALNPKQQHIITANHKIEPENFPHFLGDIYISGYRADRLEKMIEGKRNLSPKEFTEMQMDWLCTPALKFKQYFETLKMDDAELQPYVDMLLKWDGVLRPEQIEGTFYKVVKKEMIKYIYDKNIEDKTLIRELMGVGFHEIYQPLSAFLGHNTVALFRILDNPDSILLKKAGGKDHVLKTGFRRGIDWLKENFGANTKKWNWGNIHAIVFPHAFSAKPPLDKVFNVGPFPIGGDTDTPFQTYIMSENGYNGELSSVSYRQIIDFSDFDNSTIIMPLGNSANMASPYYKNQLTHWFKGESIPMSFSRKKVEEHKKHTLWLRTKRE
jgi:penicillin amidase